MPTALARSCTLLAAVTVLTLTGCAGAGDTQVDVPPAAHTVAPSRGSTPPVEAGKAVQPARRSAHKPSPRITRDTEKQRPRRTPPSPKCDAGTYVNASGHTVCRPTTQSEAGASARCRDGSFSFSEHRSGTCSHHGGVDRWLKVLP